MVDLWRGKSTALTWLNGIKYIFQINSKPLKDLLSSTTFRCLYSEAFPHSSDLSSVNLMVASFDWSVDRVLALKDEYYGVWVEYLGCQNSLWQMYLKQGAASERVGVAGHDVT